MRIYVSLLVISLFHASASVAAPAAAADALIDQGIKLRQKRELPEALDIFQRAHALSPSGRTLAQIGLTEANLKRWVDAETHLVAALDSHDTPWIATPKNRDAIQGALALVRTHIGLVSIVGPAGAEIAVAGVSVGRLPLPAAIHVPEGRARIEGSADGREASSASLLVPGGREMTVHLDLPLLPVPFATVGSSLTPAQAPSPALPLVDTTSVADSTPWRTWAGGGLLAVSAALITTGVVWVALAGDGTCSPPAGARCMNVYDTKTQGLITAGAGVVAGVVGGILLWQSHHTDTRVGLSFGTLTASGTF